MDLTLVPEHRKGDDSVHSRALPVAVIGAGPIGLAAATHLHARGLEFVILEAADDVAHSIRSWAHVRLFSPWRSNIDPGASRLLQPHGWTSPDPDQYPTGHELIEKYLHPLARHPAIRPHIRTAHRVTAITRAGVGKVGTADRANAPFVVATLTARGVERIHASAVIDASGTWGSPNPLGADGQPAIGERDAADRIDTGIPDVLGRRDSHYARKRVAVVGSGHSAQNVVRDLATLNRRRPGGTITWVIRRADVGRLHGASASDPLPERGRLGVDADDLVLRGAVALETGFAVEEVVTTDDVVHLLATDGRRSGPFDRIVAATGFRPDLDPLRELRIDLDPSLESPRALGQLIDPSLHHCGSVPRHGAAELAHPEPDFFIAGVKSYGRAPTFLLATGYQQVRSIADELARMRSNAGDVHPASSTDRCCEIDFGCSTSADLGCV